MAMSLRYSNKSSWCNEAPCGKCRQCSMKKQIEWGTRRILAATISKRLVGHVSVDRLTYVHRAVYIRHIIYAQRVHLNPISP